MIVWNGHRFSSLLAAVTELDLRDVVRVMHSKKGGHCNMLKKKNGFKLNFTAHILSERNMPHVPTFSN